MFPSALCTLAGKCMPRIVNSRTDCLNLLGCLGTICCKTGACVFCALVISESLGMKGKGCECIAVKGDVVGSRRMRRIAMLVGTSEPLVFRRPDGPPAPGALGCSPGSGDCEERWPPLSMTVGTCFTIKRSVDESVNGAEGREA